MSRTIRFHETGGPEVLKYEATGALEPKAGEVRLAVKAIGLNRAELMFRAGEYIVNPTFPTQLGYEASGTIEALGPDVDDFAVGDRVAVVPSFDIDEFGLYGETSLAPVRALVKLPDNVGWEEGAATWMAYGTAWGGLVHVGGLSKGQVVILPAASSSIGLAAIQIARMVGAIPVALSRGSYKKDALLKAGAEAVIATEEQDVHQEILKITNGRGADLLFDPVGGRLFPTLVDSLKQGGLAIVYGALSSDETPLPMLGLLVRDVTIRAYGLSDSMRKQAEIDAMKEFVTAGLESGALKPTISRIFRFDEMVEAHRYLEAGNQVGKVVAVV